MNQLQQYLHQKTTEELQTLDLDDFLIKTDETTLSRGERLRRLAILLEEDHLSGVPSPDWQMLKRVYLRALQEEPNNIDIIDSYGISATSCAEMERDPERQDEMLRDGEEMLRRGLEREPENGRLWYNLGLNLYKDNQKVLLSLAAFQRSAKCFASTNSQDRQRCMAELYIGHCLQDQRDWRGALDAYQRVDTAALANEWPRWRTEKRKEQMALCYLMLGAREVAEQLFGEVLSSYEALSPEDSDELALPDELVTAATNDLRDVLYLRTKKMLAKHDLTGRYQKYL